MLNPGAIQISVERGHLPWLLLGTVCGYLVVMFTNPVRETFRDGFRAVRRYPMLWFAFGAFGFAYALFHLGQRLFLNRMLAPEERAEFVWLRAAWRDPQWWFTGSSESLWFLPPGSLRRIGGQAIAPALENLSGLFNNFVTTFPIAAFAALLLLGNWQGHHGVLWRALRERFRRRWSWIVYAAIVLCATAAILKPLLYLLPPFLPADGPSANLWHQWGPVLAWLAFGFEYLFGVCVQIYLILLAYCWVRGLTFDPVHLLDFAIRRFSSALKWSLCVVLLSSLFIDLPLVLKNFPSFQAWFPDDATVSSHRLQIAKTLLTALLLGFATMQATLTFHSESIRAAVRDHWHFLRAHWWRLGWFLIIALWHLYVVQVFALLCSQGLGEGTAPGIACALLLPWLGGAVGGWLLASWVCFFHHCDQDARLHRRTKDVLA
ncbi:MAG TPA: hypothetical protein VGO90_02300 [Chthoniobacteraceae bacterium]|nr:hypothetical protein [Chthoniobacteraceae bacterium]